MLMQVRGTTALVRSHLRTFDYCHDRSDDAFKQQSA
jgi:hypothetical protein